MVHYGVFVFEPLKKIYYLASLLVSALSALCIRLLFSSPTFLLSFHFFFCKDMRRTDTFTHPPLSPPTHQQLSCMILWNLIF